MGMRWRPVKVDLIAAHQHDEALPLGRAIVCEVALSIDTALVARCYVTKGVMIRPSSIRVIRDGIRIYPTSDESAEVDLLKKTDSGEDTARVSEGFECHLRIRGFKLRVGDVVEVLHASEEKNETAKGTA
jgi:translation initiation factor IF-2